MGFFDGLGKKVTDAGQKTLQKTKEMSETVRINSMISDEEKMINNTYIQIGTLYVSKHKEDCEDEFAVMVNNVLEAQQRIKDYQKQIQNIKKVQRCENCGAEVQQGAAFCNSCGATMLKVQVESTDKLIKCENCGAVVKKEMSFCTQCGKAMTQPTATSRIDLDADEKKNSERVCQSCGAKIIDDSVFCTECGAKLEDTTNI